MQASRKSPCLGRGFLNRSQLEAEYGCELDTARTAAADERVADAYVTRSCDGIAAACSSDLATVRDLEASSTGVSDECRQERIREVRMVQQVEEVRAQLHCYPLGQVRGLVNGEVPFLE